MQNPGNEKFGNEMLGTKSLGTKSSGNEMLGTKSWEIELHVSSEILVIL